MVISTEARLEKIKIMAKLLEGNYIKKIKTKRPGVHSKNSSCGQQGYKKKYRGQGR